MVSGAYAYYECDLYKRYEVYGALLLGVTAALQRCGYQEHSGKLHKYFIPVCMLLSYQTSVFLSYICNIAVVVMTIHNACYTGSLHIWVGCFM